MDAAQMEGLLTNYYEYHFLYINNIHHVESRNVQGVALMKLFFHPGTDMAQAMAETVGYVNRSRAFMPPGTVLAVHHALRHRQRPGRLPGVVERDQDDRRDSGPGAVQSPADVLQRCPAFPLRRRSAATQRTVVIKVDPDKPARHITCRPMTVVDGPDLRKHHQPFGQRPASSDQMPHRARRMRLMVKDPKELGNIPVRPGSERIPARHRRTIEVSTDIPSGHALVNGRRAVYLLVTKRADASTLAVVNRGQKQACRRCRPEVPEEVRNDIEVSFEFDQSPFVTRDQCGASCTEGALGRPWAHRASWLLLFLHDLAQHGGGRPQHPASPSLGSVVALWLDRADAST